MFLKVKLSLLVPGLQACNSDFLHDVNEKTFFLTEEKEAV